MRVIIVGRGEGKRRVSGQRAAGVKKGWKTEAQPCIFSKMIFLLKLK